VDIWVGDHLAVLEYAASALFAGAQLNSKPLDLRPVEVAMRNRSRLVALLVLAMGACGGETPSLSIRGFERWDSAGIIISQSTDSIWNQDTRWRIDPEPSVVIGTREGSDPHFTFGRISSVDVLSDGRLVVADGMANEIRVFNRDGQYLNTLGREGPGPREFSGLGRIAVLAGDSIVGRDNRASRNVIFASDGSDSRTVTGPSIHWNGLVGVYVAGWMPDGSSIVSHSVQRSEYPPGTNLVTAEWHLFDPDGYYRVFIGRLPEIRAHNEGAGAAPLAFSRRAEVYPDSLGFWHGFPERYELVHHTADGIDRIVRIDREPPRITGEIRESYRAWDAESARIQAERLPPEFRYVVEARVEELTFSERVPAYRRFLLSKDGCFWLASYETIDELSDPSRSWDERPEEKEWTILSPEGLWLGSVTVPSGVSVRVVTQDWVVGLRTDEMDVQYVVVHRLLKPT